MYTYFENIFNQSRADRTETFPCVVVHFLKEASTSFLCVFTQDVVYLFGVYTLGIRRFLFKNERAILTTKEGILFSRTDSDTDIFYVLGHYSIACSTTVLVIQPVDTKIHWFDFFSGSIPLLNTFS